MYKVKVLYCDFRQIFLAISIHFNLLTGSCVDSWRISSTCVQVSPHLNCSLYFQSVFILCLLGAQYCFSAVGKRNTWELVFAWLLLAVETIC
jgi:hypothetical protein